MLAAVATTSPTMPPTHSTSRTRSRRSTSRTSCARPVNDAGRDPVTADAPDDSTSGWTRVVTVPLRLDARRARVGRRAPGLRAGRRPVTVDGQLVAVVAQEQFLQRGRLAHE